MAKFWPCVWNRGGVKAGEVGAADACPTLWPELKIHIFSQKLWSKISSHLKESPLLITFFPLVLKFLNLKFNDDSWESYQRRNTRVVTFCWRDCHLYKSYPLLYTRYIHFFWHCKVLYSQVPQLTWKVSGQVRTWSTPHPTRRSIQSHPLNPLIA